MQINSDILALLLSVQSSNFSISGKTEILKEVCKELGILLSFDVILQTSKQILESFKEDLEKGNQEGKKTLNETIEKLYKLQQADILKEEEFLTLKKQIEEILSTKVKIGKREMSYFNDAFLANFFSNSLEVLSKEANNLVALENNQEESQELKSCLQKILNNAREQKFSIGVSGVLSAGKSTFLNALFKREVLGSSSIPETASLTILKYGEERARVHFWNMQEWEIMQSFLEEEIIEKLEKESKDKITKEGRSLEILLSDLRSYTSANADSKLATLAKYNEIFLPVEFLKNDVEIVDTPGLDDPMLQREQITKQYLERCDLLIHVMNVSQSATQVDMDFLLEALEYGNLARILVVLTHIDLVKEEEFQEVLEYTKSTLRSKIAKNKEELLKRIAFVGVASYPALLYATNPNKAKELGLKEANMKEVEQYLEDILFGENSLKSKDIIYLSSNAMLKVAKQIESGLELQEKMLFSSEEKILEFIQKLQNKKADLQKELQDYKIQIENAKIELENYLLTQEKFLELKLLEAQEILVKRVCDEIVYHKGKTINKEFLKEKILQGLKDFLIDILREFYQKLEQKILQISSPLEKLKLKTRAYHFANNLEAIYSVYSKISKEVLKQIGAKELQKAIMQSFSEGMQTFKEELFVKSEAIKKELIKNFTEAKEELFKELEAQIMQEEKILNQALKEQSKQEKYKKQEELLGKLESVQKSMDILEELKMLGGCV
ncbi:dynamin family protein [Helicobacter burdigaliensis]|uniref:dynamin family protein n=1 Tax=Helicobacter burdigaliensis TaxID=2315334 RepID=UPI000EF699B7|nr:dynamin family protein [Helicobacter burdigaliensis]